MKKTILISLFICLDLFAAGFRYRIPVLDTSSGRIVIDILFYGEPSYFKSVPEGTIKSFLRTLAHDKLLYWFSRHPAYGLEFDTLYDFETWSHYSGLQGLDGGQAKARIEYRLTKGLSPFSSTNHRYRPDKSKLTIGIYSGRRSLEAIKKDVLYRTDVLFARKVGFYLGRKISISAFNRKKKCLRRLYQGKIDLAIVRMPEDVHFPKDIVFSDPYFETGDVFCSQDLTTVKVMTFFFREKIAPMIKLGVVDGNRSCEYLHSCFQGTSLISDFSEILFLRQELHDKSKGLDNAFISELEACADYELVMVESSEKRCWTRREHVVLGKNRRLIGSVNKVIAQGGVRHLYASMSGRSKRK